MSNLSQDVADKLAEWGQREPVPVEVTIGHSTYLGARYLDHYSREPRYYLLGECPPSRRRGRVVYRIPGDDADWYIGAWIDAERVQEYGDYHPFGPWFQLHRWSHETLGRLDQHELRKAKRMNINVKELSRA